MSNAVENLSKRVAINNANARMVIVVAVAAFVTIFCLIASKTVFSQTKYQAKVTSVKQTAYSQLQKNITAFSSLSSTYNDFVSKPTNIIGGSSTGTGSNDGDNSKIILDALPQTYDFPALASSLEKILTGGGFQIASITGTDDQLNQQSNVSSASPQPVPMPFSFSVDHANYSSISQLVTQLNASIRPIQIDSLSLTGGASDMTVTVNAHTYYQPALNLTISKKVVK
jgi:hypothetical protein